MSQYIVSARKYRPDSFETLIGQDVIARTLKNSIARGKIAHAYLFCGPRGVGKTSTARIFAKAINCSDPTDDLEPCGKCESCVSFQEGRSFCIHELDAASNNGVEDIKALLEKVQIPPQVGKYSVYIIDEVHMLSQAAFNAFLKTLEEPPAHAVFILATTEKHKIIPTILSRCQTYDFNRISVSDIVRNLSGIAQKEGITIDDKSLHVIADKADGAMRDALTIFDQTVAFCGQDIRYEDVIRNLNVLDYEYGFSLVGNFLSGDYASALRTFDEILSRGFNALYFISSLSSHLRNLMVSKAGGLDSLLDLPDSLKAQFSEQAAKCPLKFLYDALTVTTQCEAGYRNAVNQRLSIEFALMKLSFLLNAPADAPSVPAAAPSAVQARAAAPQPAASVAPQVRPATPQAPAAEAQQPRRRAPRPASSLSLTSLMNGTDDEEETAPAATAGVEEAPLPADESILDKWKDLVAQTTQPRLANALGNAKLAVREEDGRKVVSFTVTNEAQKKWIEERMLRSLEDSFCRIVGSGKLRLEPAVAPEEDTAPKIYMPAEKAEDLISRNEEFKNFVIDFGLDIK